MTAQYGQQSPFYPSEDTSPVGHFEGGRAVGEDIAQDFGDYISMSEGIDQRSIFGMLPSMEQQTPRRNKGKGKERASPTSPKGWAVPEGNRVQLRVLDFHIPDRYIKVRVQKALPRKDGTREERENIITW
jgi:hypothetical protein